MSSKNLNTVNLSGRLTKDCTITKSEKTNKALVSASIAVNDCYKDKAGTFHDEVSYFDIEAWTLSTDYYCNNLKKGSFIIFEGKAKQKRWEKNGQSFSKVVFQADRISVLDLAKKDNTESPDAPIEVEEADTPFDN